MFFSLFLFVQVIKFIRSFSSLSFAFLFLFSLFFFVLPFRFSPFSIFVLNQIKFINAKLPVGLMLATNNANINTV